MKKIVGLLLFAITVALAALCLSACGDSGGKDGADGINGKSAYEIWLDNGYTGTQGDFLEWLKGNDGKNGTNGGDGLSAYEIWGANGHSGTQTDFLVWLKGQNGSDGLDGADGKDGQNGLSAYEIFLRYNPDYLGDEEQWINALSHGRLIRRTITFKAADETDIVRTVFSGFDLTDIPSVPEKYGNSGVWDISDFTNITQDMTVTAQYTTDCLVFTPTPNSMEYSVSAPDQADDLEYVIIPETYNGRRVTAIADYAFDSAPNLKTVVLHDSIRTIGYFAFADCKKLTNINIPYMVTELNSSFGFDLLPNLTYEEDDKAYYLGDERSPYSVMVKAKDNSITEFEVEYSVRIIYARAFYGCNALTDITVYENVRQIGEQAFYGCGALKNVTLPYGVNIFGNGVFEDCISLETIDIPDTVKTIGERAFSGCIALSEIKLPFYIARIERLTFESCISLKSIVILQRITYIGNSSFLSCNSLVNVYYGGSETQRQKIEIAADNACLLDATWHYETTDIAR